MSKKKWKEMNKKRKEIKKKISNNTKENIWYWIDGKLENTYGTKRMHYIYNSLFYFMRKSVGMNNLLNSLLPEGHPNV